jgi:hypothetical protein
MKTLLTALALLSATLPAAAQSLDPYPVSIDLTWICSQRTSDGSRYCVDTERRNIAISRYAGTDTQRVNVVARLARESADGTALAVGSFLTVCNRGTGDVPKVPVFQVVSYANIGLASPARYERADKDKDKLVLATTMALCLSYRLLINEKLQELLQ